MLILYCANYMTFVTFLQLLCLGNIRRWLYSGMLCNIAW